MVQRMVTAPTATGESADCSRCGFGLWLPIMRMNESEIGLYSDSRFPGRCIVTMQDHFDHISDVPAFKLMTFMEEVQFSVEAIKAATGCERVNVAILGNAESHVHAHLVPRHPDREPRPNKAPWEDPRKKEQLTASEEERLMDAIRSGLEQSLTKSAKVPILLSGRRRPRQVHQSLPDVALFDLISDGESAR